MRPSDSAPDAPERGPFGALARALIAALPDSETLFESVTRLAAAFEEAPGEAVARLETALAVVAAREGSSAARTRLVVYVDQLEELFTLADLVNRAGPFLAALARLAQSATVWVIATLRSDFAHRLEAFPALTACLQRGESFTLLPPRPDELADMIREPAAAAGLLWDARDGVSLDQALLRDATANPEALPLLEYALAELYERREGRLLKWAHYEGGLAAVLIREADRVVGSGSEVDAALGTVLRELVGISEEGTATRRYAPAHRFADDAAARALLERLVGARLCVMTEAGHEEGPVACLAHEALIRSWPRVQRWLEAETVLIRMRDEIARDAAAWQRHGRSDDWLGTSPDKLASLRQVERARLLPPGLVAEYAARSRRRGTRNLRIRRGVVAGIGALTLVSAVAGILAVHQRDRARLQEAAADRTAQFMVSLFQVADPSQARADTLMVRELLDRGSRAIGQGLEQQPEIRADLLTAMGRAYSGLGLYDEAEKLLGQARADQARSSTGAAAQIRTLVASGVGRFAAGDFERAEPLLRQAVELARSALPAASTLRSDALANLALLLAQSDRADEAIALCEESLRADRERGPEGAAQLSLTLNALGTAYFYRNDLAAAEAPLREALAVRQRAFGEVDSRTLLSMNDLGVLLYQSGRYVEAGALQRKALAIAEQVYGRDHPEVATALNNAARSELMAGHVDAAEPLFRRGLALDEKLASPDSDQLVAPLNSLAMIDIAKGRYSEARLKLERAERIARLPGRGRLLDQVLVNRADLDCQAGDWTDAARRLTEARELLAQTYPLASNPGDEWRYRVVDSVDAVVLAANGRGAEARNLIGAARKVLRVRFGEQGFYVVQLDRRDAAVKRAAAGRGAG